jgi:hypothetical protein
MPWTERQRCQFELYPSSDGHPSRLYVDFNSSNPSLLPCKQIGRMFFAIRDNVTWAEADALVGELGKMVDLFCINHLAAGEGAARVEASPLAGEAIRGAE